MDDLVSEFALEAVESLAGLQAGLAGLSLRRDSSTPVAEMRRCLHGLKGLCSFVGMARTEAVAHAAESLLEAFDQRSAPPTCSELALLGDAIQRIAELIAIYVYDHMEPCGDDGELLDALEAAAAVAPGDRSPASLGAPPEGLVPCKQDRRAREPWWGLDGLARALGDRLGKRIDLVVGGDDLRIERSVAAPLRAALIALVRNACDHGVEAPAERRSLGKTPTALLHLTVRRTADGLAIDLVDDGRGIDPSRVRACSITSGRLEPAEAEALTDEQVQALVFTPGLTTTSVVTPVSGRGLGLEVVRREVDRLGGKVEMSSTPGHGARFTLDLPGSVLADPASRGLAAA